MKKIFSLIIFILVVFSFNVYASNDIEYSLTITKDYDFKEVIKYNLTDYKPIQNGDNYFDQILNDDIYTDIFYNTKYKKTKKKLNNGYQVILSHTYNEYTMSNANFLNNCFEKRSYDYDMDKISYQGKSGFICFRGDSLSIQIKTDFEVTKTNAITEGNTYTWKPTSDDFTMNFVMNKTYPEVEPKEQSEAGVIIPEPDEDVDKDAGTEQNQPKKKEKSNKTTTIIIISIILVSGLIVIITLKAKKNNLNKI